MTIKHWEAFDLWVNHSVFLAQRGHICSSLIHRADSGMMICFPWGCMTGCYLLSGHKIVALAKTGNFVKSWKFIDNRYVCQSNLLSRLPRQLWCVKHTRHDLKQKIYAVGWHAKYRSVSFLFLLGHYHSPFVTSALSIHSVQDLLAPVTSSLMTTFRWVDLFSLGRYPNGSDPTALCCLLHLS